MKLFARRRAATRAEPKKRSLVWYTDADGFDGIQCSGYTSLAQNPEVVTAVGTIAKLIGSMTIHLMQNTDDGDVRIKNELSRKVDINPNQYMTRSTFVQSIVKTMLLDGHGNALVYPQTTNGYLENLIPIPASLTSFIPDDWWSYKVMIAGREYDPANILHFVANPDPVYPWKGIGYQVALRDIVNNLKQATSTEKAFMQSKWKPSVIVKVDALTEEFSSPEGRRRLLDSYIDTTGAGEPWLIPAEQFSVEQVRPLTLSDLALADFVQIDKKAVASILGVPPFVLGVGDFHREEWNNFISTTIMPIAKGIEQELSRKLLYSNELYFRFSSRSLYTYDLTELSNVADAQYVRGIMTGNEVRDWLGLSPKEGLNELVILENYIPRGMIGEQSKLNGGDSN